MLPTPGTSNVRTGAEHRLPHSDAGLPSSRCRPGGQGGPGDAAGLRTHLPAPAPPLPRPRRFGIVVPGLRSSTRSGLGTPSKRGVTAAPNQPTTGTRSGCRLDARGAPALRGCPAPPALLRGDASQTPGPTRGRDSHFPLESAFPSLRVCAEKHPRQRTGMIP